MPEMTGPMLIAELHTRGVYIPTILLTGDADPDSLRSGIASTLPVLHKPVSSSELVGAVYAACRGLESVANG